MKNLLEIKLYRCILFVYLECLAGFEGLLVYRVCLQKLFLLVGTLACIQFFMALYQNSLQAGFLSCFPEFASFSQCILYQATQPSAFFSKLAAVLYKKVILV